MAGGARCGRFQASLHGGPVLGFTDPQYSQSTRSLRVNMYSASTISKQWKLPTAVIYWAPLSTGCVGGLQGFHCSNERFRHKNIPVSFSYLWIWSYLQPELDLQNFPYCQIWNCQAVIYQTCGTAQSSTVLCLRASRKNANKSVSSIIADDAVIYLKSFPHVVPLL